MSDTGQEFLEPKRAAIVALENAAASVSGAAAILGRVAYGLV